MRTQDVKCIYSPLPPPKQKDQESNLRVNLGPQQLKQRRLQLGLPTFVPSRNAALSARTGKKFSAHEISNWTRDISNWFQNLRPQQQPVRWVCELDLAFACASLWWTLLCLYFECPPTNVCAPSLWRAVRASSELSSEPQARGCAGEGVGVVEGEGVEVADQVLPRSSTRPAPPAASQDQPPALIRGSSARNRCPCRTLITTNPWNLWQTLVKCIYMSCQVDACFLPSIYVKHIYLSDSCQHVCQNGVKLVYQNVCTQPGVVWSCSCICLRRSHAAAVFAYAGCGAHVDSAYAS